eukprot:TRINITY_DN16215_c0_g2_i1.p1 TRINITY_DN16215_c0_g2~~TRINITY_DN16215_c0_g2_i1.p1  ORF type:complete len:143 (+),score=17.24 TRINITY_DN16215_c0_g2_i1:163-591(+)
MSGGNVSSTTIHGTVLQTFTDIQTNPSYSRSIRTLKQCLLQSQQQTFRAFTQLTLQLFAWQHKSQRIGRVYNLVKKFLESCVQSAFELNSTVKSIEEVNALYRSANGLAKELLLLSCSACNAASYLVTVSYTHLTLPTICSV